MSDLKKGVNDELDHQRKEGVKDQASGTWDEVKGKVKKTVGDLTDNHSMEAEGRMEEAGGKLKKNAGDLRSDAAGSAKDAIN